MENSRLRNLLDQYSARIDQLLIDRAQLQRRLHQIQSSTSWRLTAPFRMVVNAMKAMQYIGPISHSRLSGRKAQHSSRWAAKASPSAPPKLVARDFDICPGESKHGWFGRRDIKPHERYRGLSPFESPVTLQAADGDAHNVRETTEPLHQRLGSREMIRRLVDAVSAERMEACGFVGTLVLVTRLSDLSDGIEQTLQSVADLAELTTAKHQGCQIHWRIVSAERAADTQVQVATLRERIGDRVSVDICDMNFIEFASSSKATWILPLVANARISADATDILIHYISKFPQSRMVVAPIVVQPDCRPPSQNKVYPVAFAHVFESDHFADSALAVRADIFLAKPDGVSALLTSSFDFMLRIAVNEPILAIPESLLSRKQGTDERSRAMVARRGRSRFLRHLLACPHDSPNFKREMRDTPRGLCVIRTQGNRMGTLREAVESTTFQSLDLVPCIVVHGSKDVFTAIATMFSTYRSVVVLPAPDMKKKRGYPCNVALSYLEERRDAYDFLCFLDDDDLLFPTFAGRLVDGLRHSRADVAFGVSNGISEDQAICVRHTPLPLICLCTGNFIPINSFVVRVDMRVTGASATLR